MPWWFDDFQNRLPPEQARMRLTGHLGMALPVQRVLQSIEHLDEQENMGFETRRTDPRGWRRKTRSSTPSRLTGGPDIPAIDC